MSDTRYEEVAARLRAAIEEDYEPGSRLPTNQALVEQFGVSLTTIREALRLLVLEGLVETRKRGGTVVRDTNRVAVALSRYAAVLDPAGTLGPWETACQRSGLEGGMIAKSVTVSPAAPDVAQHLGRKGESPDVICRHRHATVTVKGRAGKPRTDTVQIQSAYYLADRFAGTPLALPEKIPSGIYAAMRGMGIELGRPTERITSRLATREEAEILGLRASGLPVLVLHRTTPDQAGTVLEYLRIVTDPERVEFVYDDLPLGG